MSLANIENMANLFDELEGGLCMLVREYDDGGQHTGCWYVMYGAECCDESRLYSSLDDLVIGETTRLEALKIDRAASARRDAAAGEVFVSSRTEAKP